MTTDQRIIEMWKIEFAFPEKPPVKVPVIVSGRYVTVMTQPGRRYPQRDAIRSDYHYYAPTRHEALQELVAHWDTRVKAQQDYLDSVSSMRRKAAQQLEKELTT